MSRSETVDDRWLELPSGVFVNLNQVVAAGTMRLNLPEHLEEYASEEVKEPKPNRVMTTDGHGMTLDDEDFRALVGYIRGRAVKLS